MIFGFFFSKFPKDISFWKLSGYWLAFLVVGVAALSGLNVLFPGFADAQNEITSDENFCTFENIVLVMLAPFTEFALFMFLPWKLYSKHGAVIGLAAWSALHAFSTLPVVAYMVVMAVFYYRCLQLGRWKEMILFHFLTNMPGALSVSETGLFALFQKSVAFGSCSLKIKGGDND